MDCKRSLADLRIEGEGRDLVFGFPLPTLREDGKQRSLGCPGAWKWTGRSEDELSLGSLGVGRVITDSFAYEGFVLDRSLWYPRGGDSGLAVRFSLTAGRRAALHHLSPASVRIIPRDVEGENATLYIQGRLKNESPRLLMGNIPPEDSKQHEKGEAGTEGLSSDPFLQIAFGKEGTQGQLFLGFLTLTSQLCRCEAEWNGDREMLGEITAVCELDGVELSPGCRRESEWLWVDWGNSPQRALDNYTQAVSSLSGAVPDPAPPALYLSWYYMSDAFSQEDLEENLLWLRENPVPLDVVLIDECWDRRWGDWEANHRWPEGMAYSAARISALGYTPGLWTCPYLVEPRSTLLYEHPEWTLKGSRGEDLTFSMNSMQARILDPTHPGVEEWLRESYRRFTHDWGFTFHKLDFMRAVILDESARFHDLSSTRAEAYRRGLQAIRDGAGPEAYILVCGGAYGPSLGLADGQRSGSDVHARWDQKTHKTLKQSLLRFWMGRLWHTDPDALMIRRRSEPFKKNPMSLGFFTDNEARVLTLNQYLTGGMVSVSERLLDFDRDRLRLWRHIIPPLACPAVPRDLYSCKELPAVYHTRVEPRGEGLKPWHTIALVNTGNCPRKFSLSCDRNLLGTDCREDGEFLVWDFFSEKFLGHLGWGNDLPEITVPPHDAGLLRLAPWDGTSPVVLATDLHFSGGGVEITDWRTAPQRVEFTLETGWKGPVTIWVAFPNQSGEPEIAEHTVKDTAEYQKVTILAP